MNLNVKALAVEIGVLPLMILPREYFDLSISYSLSFAEGTLVFGISFFKNILCGFSETEEPVTEGEKNVEAEKQSGPEVTENKDSPVTETEEKKEEPEDKVVASSIYDKMLPE